MLARERDQEKTLASSAIGQSIASSGRAGGAVAAPALDPSGRLWYQGRVLGPLDGLRVVDCSAIIAGPIATAFLATYGADVVKLEPLEGDALRGYPSTLPGLSRYFLGINRGKRSLAVDLKHADGLAVARRLARTADVFVESFRPGVAARLGLDDASAPRRQRRGSSTARCPRSARRAPGRAARASTRSSSPTAGSRGSRARPTAEAPELVRGSLVDYYTGSLAVSGILLALIARGHTGVGQRLETSLLDGVLAMQAGRVFWAEAAEPPEAVRDLLGDRVSRIYPTRDGHLYLYVELPKFWRAMCRTLGLDAWLRTRGSRRWSVVTRTRRS